MILAIDTSNDVTKINLYDNELRKISGKELMLGGVLSEKLLIEIENLLLEKEASKADLSKILVNSGPGSYTGLRIGISVANFLAYTLNIPVLPLSTAADSREKKADYKANKSFVNPVIPFYQNPPHIT